MAHDDPKPELPREPRSPARERERATRRGVGEGSAADPAKAPAPREDDEIARWLLFAGPRPPVDPERMERVRRAVRTSWAAEVRRRRVVRWLAFSAAGAAAAVLAAVLLVPRWGLQRFSSRTAAGAVATLERIQGPVKDGGGSDLGPGGRVFAGSAISTGAGGRAALKLASGASLRLDSGTTLRLATARTLDLERGAVYIDSGDAGDGRSAVAVRTFAGTVRDVGTRFAVRIADDRLLVTVREGAASLGREGGRLEIREGTRLTAGPGGEISRAAVSPDASDWDWVMEIAPPLPLENRTLGEFLAWVSRETGWQVRFADPAAARERSSVVLHGSLEGLRPDQAPSAILPTCGLTSHMEGNVLVVENQDAPGRSTP